MTTAAHDRLPIPGCPGTRKKAEINETAYGTWVGYSGGARIWLALVLVAVAAGLTYLGVRLRLPMRPIRPGRAVATFMLVTWVLSIVTFLVCATAYAEQIRQLKLLGAAPANPITTVTFTAAALLFVIISALGRAQGLKVAVTGAAIGAMAAPLIFELPFDLIVMARTYPPIPPYPGLYRALFFLPLFLVEISTLALLTMSSMVALTRGTFISLALMFLIFAVWALAGFVYPSSLVPIGLNTVSKILAFVAALTLFLQPDAWKTLQQSVRRQRGQPMP